MAALNFMVFMPTLNCKEQTYLVQQIFFRNRIAVLKILVQNAEKSEFKIFSLLISNFISTI